MSADLSRAELEAMDRDELIETVIEMSRSLEELEARFDGLSQRNRKLQSVVAGSPDDFYAIDSDDAGVLPRLDAVESRADRLENEIEAIRDLGSERTSKEEKIAQVVIYAENETSKSQTRTTVLPKTIKGVAGVSRRYAYDLVEDMIDEYDWALDPQEQDRRVDQDTPQKGVLVDLERLHEDPEAVNKFTTALHENGGGE